MMKSRVGRVGTKAQSTCFCLPVPKALVMFQTTFVGPTITDVPVSTMPKRLELILQLVPLKMMSSRAIAQQLAIFKLQYLNSPVQYLVLTPPRTNADPLEPATFVKQNEKEFPETFPCCTSKSKINGSPFTEIDGQAIPKIPSNLEAKKLMPCNVVICAKREFLAYKPATQVESWPTKPATAPDPQVILNLVPLQTQVELLEESQYL